MPRRIFLWTLMTLMTLSLGVAGARAEESQGPSACVEEIKTVCVGMEDSLEHCLAERSARLTETCRDFLQGSITYIQNAGASVCVADVKKYCLGLEGDSLGRCVRENKASFSQACQDFLVAPAPTSTAGTAPR